MQGCALEEWGDFLTLPGPGPQLKIIPSHRFWNSFSLVKYQDSEFSNTNSNGFESSRGLICLAIQHIALFLETQHCFITSMMWSPEKFVLRAENLTFLRRFTIDFFMLCAHGFALRFQAAISTNSFFKMCANKESPFVTDLNANISINSPFKWLHK
ncbi:unnamed protein product [Lepidochelys kempii]